MMKQQQQSTNQADVEAINNVREAHIAALNNGDADAWVAAFTDDGVQMPPQCSGQPRQREYPGLVAVLLSSFPCTVRAPGR